MADFHNVMGRIRAELDTRTTMLETTNGAFGALYPFVENAIGGHNHLVEIVPLENAISEVTSETYGAYEAPWMTIKVSGFTTHEIIICGLLEDYEDRPFF